MQIALLDMAIPSHMIVITGSPGTGKHTVSGRLSSDMGLAITDINGVAIKAGLVDDSGIVDTDKLADTLKDVDSKTIIVGHLAPYVVSTDAVDSCIVLRRSPYALEDTYESRGYAQEKSLENLGAEILGVTVNHATESFGTSKVHQLDNTVQSAAETVARIRNILEGYGEGDDVDWLGEIERRGDMRRFFAYV